MSPPHKLYYHLWSNKHMRWWKPGAMGYTAYVDEAGLFTEEQAVEYVVQSASNGVVSLVTCMVVAAPKYWPPHLRPGATTSQGE